MQYSLDQLIKEAGKLPPIPQAVQKALAIIQNPDVDATQLSRIIETDQVLAAHVLRWSNSAYFGMMSGISTVKQAIVVLGLNKIQELIMTHGVSELMKSQLPGYELRNGDLWQHAVGTAIGAKLISKQQHLKIDEEAYAAGLLCDIGKVIFEKLLRDTDISQTNARQYSFLDIERNTFGVDHAQLGSEIARLWELPEYLASVIAHHHTPLEAGTHSLIASAVHVADSTMMLLGIGIGVDGLNYPLDLEALKQLNLTGADLMQLMEKISEQLSKAKELINID